SNRLPTRASRGAVNCVRPINLARSLTGILESKRVDECGPRSRLLSSTRVVQEEPWERLTPLLEDANERTGIKRRRGAILSDGDHVLLDELSVMDAGVVPARHEIDSAFIGGDIEHHVRIVARELTELRSKDRSRGQRRADEPHASRRLVAPSGDLFEGRANIG